MHWGLPFQFQYDTLSYKLKNHVPPPRLLSHAMFHNTVDMIVFGQQKKADCYAVIYSKQSALSVFRY